jgi:hypothetical protein
MKREVTTPTTTKRRIFVVRTVLQTVVNPTDLNQSQSI